MGSLKNLTGGMKYPWFKVKEMRQLRGSIKSNGGSRKAAAFPHMTSKWSLAKILTGILSKPIKCQLLPNLTI
jgi:hypothetical protein